MRSCVRDVLRGWDDDYDLPIWLNSAPHGSDMTQRAKLSLLVAFALVRIFALQWSLQHVTTWVAKSAVIVAAAILYGLIARLAVKPEPPRSPPR